MFFTNLETVPATGRYRIKIRATGVDRDVYDEEETGTYHGDPIRLNVHLGDRVRTFELPDNEVKVIELGRMDCGGHENSDVVPNGWPSSACQWQLQVSVRNRCRLHPEKRSRTVRESAVGSCAKVEGPKQIAGPLESLDRLLAGASTSRFWCGSRRADL